MFGVIHLEHVVKLLHGLDPRLKVDDEVEFLVRLARSFVKGRIHTRFDTGMEVHGVEM